MPYGRYRLVKISNLDGHGRTLIDVVLLRLIVKGRIAEVQAVELPLLS